MVSLSSPLFFSFSGSFSLPFPSTYQFCSQTPLSQCFSLHAQLNADLPRYSHIGAVIKVGRYAVHLDMLKAWKSCNELTFSNMFIPVFKRSDPRNPLYHVIPIGLESCTSPRSTLSGMGSLCTPGG